MANFWAVLVAFSMAGLCQCLSHKTPKSKVEESSRSMDVQRGADIHKTGRVPLTRFVRLKNFTIFHLHIFVMHIYKEDFNIQYLPNKSIK